MQNQTPQVEDHISQTEALLSDLEIKIKSLTDSLQDEQISQSPQLTYSVKSTLLDLITNHTILTNQLLIMDLITQPKSSLILPK